MCFVVQGDDDEADWDLEMMNEEDDAVMHWVSNSCFEQPQAFLIIAAVSPSLQPLQNPFSGLQLMIPPLGTLLTVAT